MLRLSVICIAIGVGGCAVTTPFVRTKPVYDDVPREALYAVALEIETAVQQRDRDAVVADRDGIVVSGDAFRQAFRTRIVRADLVNDFRATNHSVEKRDGLLWIIRGTKVYKESTTRREKDRDALLVMSENDDRRAIYAGIQKASNLPIRTLSAIQRIFYEARLEVMPQGQLFETNEGEIVATGG